MPPGGKDMVSIEVKILGNHHRAEDQPDPIHPLEFGSKFHLEKV